VTNHCTASAPIDRAVAAGADSLEHGYFAAPATLDAYDPSVVERVVTAGITITPTVQVFRDMAELLPAGAERDFWQRRRETLVEHVGRLRQDGVTFTAGSDAGWRLTRFDSYWRELDELHRCGLEPLAVIHAATGAASRAIGRADEFGTLQPGLQADLLLVEGNVAQDIRAIQAVRSVYRAGQRVRPA
jgi:imidazolonepropionase-like amidohydrolase